MRRSPAKAEKLTRVLARLTGEYGPEPYQSRGPALGVFVAMMLSQNTSAANAGEGYRRLRRDLPSWSAVRDADVTAVQRAIAVCGLGRMRAHRIRALLRKVESDFGRLTLAPVGRMPRGEAEAYLGSFHGIGPKTVACTMLFAFGFPVFPVDNGVLRVLRRLRVVPPTAKDVAASAVVEGHTADADRHALHVLTYRHAKDVCRPRNPKCGECCLLDLCPSGKLRLRHRPTRADPPPKPGRRRKSLSSWAGAGVARDDPESRK